MEAHWRYHCPFDNDGQFTHNATIDCMRMYALQFNSMLRTTARMNRLQWILQRSIEHKVDAPVSYLLFIVTNIHTHVHSIGYSDIVALTANSKHILCVSTHYNDTAQITTVLCCRVLVQHNNTDLCCDMRVRRVISVLKCMIRLQNPENL